MSTSEHFADATGQLTRGGSLWKLATHTALVDQPLTAAERAICDTDTRMRG